MKLIEVRTYKLKPGTADQFVAAFELALPLVRESGMDVVAFGRSDHEHGGVAGQQWLGPVACGLTVGFAWVNRIAE